MTISGEIRGSGDNVQEQEKLRKEALLLAERERHKKYRRQDEEREVVRQQIRDKVDILSYFGANSSIRITDKQPIKKFDL